MNTLTPVAFRQQALFIPASAQTANRKALAEPTAVLVANISKLGFQVSEPLLHALNQTSPAFQLQVLNQLKNLCGVNKNWTPLVKGWDTPTGESVTDHIMTFFANVFKARGVTLACGHIIPQGTFPLERYNGCPYCGTPFETNKLELLNQGSKKKVLDLWTEETAATYFADLLRSKTALDATQIDSLKILMKALPLPEVSVGMKETLMTVIDLYVEADAGEKAQALFTSPTDIMRYLWYKHTGFLQIIEPKTIIKRTSKNNRHIFRPLDTSAQAKFKSAAELKLKYTRKQCMLVAGWLNAMNLPADKMCEMMHPKRNMWVRFIRALRLAEYSKRAGFEKLREMLDVFYNETYDVWQGRVNHYRLRAEADKTFALLKQRPGLFARSLFANMLWFGSDETIAAFEDVIDKVPARLVFTLNMYAARYFDKSNRTVKPLGGNSKNVAPNAMLEIYSDEQLEAMKNAVSGLCILAMKKRFAAVENKNLTMYIEPGLFNIPVSIGDRSDNVQDLPSALMGTRFPVDGDQVRLFMQWGTGMKAQHLDMDLSCQIVFKDYAELCAFHQLTATGCKHSGDIRSIPNNVGTAEYIEINLSQLRAARARFVVFTCNAYSNGSITPNLVVGWMNSAYPMKVSGRTGVAYDPSCVQHQVRVTSGLSKGLVFGVLDVEQAEVIWLEMPFGGQLAANMSFRAVYDLLGKLKSKLSIGALLQVKAEAQGLQIIEDTDADEAYTLQWARNTAAVTQLLVD